MGALQFTERFNSEVVAGSVLLWTREAPPRALCDRGVTDREEGGWGTWGHRGVWWLWVRTWTKSLFVWDAWERAAKTTGMALWPEEPAWARSTPKSEHPKMPRGALPCQPPPSSFYQLFVARVCLLNGIVRADDCNCANKILIVRSLHVPAAVGVAELSAVGPG